MWLLGARIVQTTQVTKQLPRCVSIRKQVLKQFQSVGLLIPQFWQMPLTETAWFWSKWFLPRNHTEGTIMHYKCKKTTVMCRVRQKARLAQWPLANSTNKVHLQKVGWKKETVSLFLTFLPGVTTYSNQGTCWTRDYLQKSDWRTTFFTVNLPFYVSALHYTSWQ